MEEAENSKLKAESKTMEKKIEVGFLNYDENRRLLQGTCPDCWSMKIIYGPCGGMSQDVLCEGCRTEFCMGLISERLASPCDLKRQREIYGL